MRKLLRLKSHAHKYITQEATARLNAATEKKPQRTKRSEKYDIARR